MRDAAELRRQFASRLIEACEDKGLPERGRQTALAKQFGVSQQAARKWLDGESFPEVDKVIAMAEWLEVNVNWLLQGVGAKSLDKLPTRALVIDEVMRHGTAEERRELVNFIRYKLANAALPLPPERLQRYVKALDTYVGDDASAAAGKRRH
jgi:transcriptional regulator with XRE-family HTH domain